MQIDATRMISEPDFDRAYDTHVLGRMFVENHDYYRQSRQRFREGFRRIEALGLPAGTTAMDIGGGITGVLLAKLLDFDVTVADVVETTRGDIEEQGLSFALIDLFRDGPPPVEDLDLIVLQEVIEHIPQPPYLVFNRIAAMLAPGGRLFLTTPNGHRFRNLIYMMLGREILDIYRYPEDGKGLGHQHEYTLKQLIWQAGHADFVIEMAEYYRDGWRGATPGARLARLATAPADLIPHFRNSIAMMLRRPV